MEAKGSHIGLLHSGGYMRIASCVAALVVLLVAVTPAWALRKQFNAFSAEVPASWTARAEAASVTLAARGGACTVRVVAIRYGAPDMVALARERAGIGKGEDSLRMLPQGRGAIFSTAEGRTWITVADGKMLEVCVSAPHALVLDVLRGFRGRPEDAGWTQAIAMMQNSPDILNWLAYRGEAPAGDIPAAKPRAAAMPDFARYGVLEGENPAPPLLEKIPAGWTTATAGAWTLVISGNSAQWLATRVYPLAPGDRSRENGSTLRETAKMLASLLGGRNIVMAEGSAEFATPAGLVVLDPKQGDTTQIFFFCNKDTAYEWYRLMEAMTR